MITASRSDTSSSYADFWSQGIDDIWQNWCATMYGVLTQPWISVQYNILTISSPEDTNFKSCHNYPPDTDQLMNQWSTSGQAHSEPWFTPLSINHKQQKIEDRRSGYDMTAHIDTSICYIFCTVCILLILLHMADGLCKGYVCMLLSFWHSLAVLTTYMYGGESRRTLISILALVMQDTMNEKKQNIIKNYRHEIHSSNISYTDI